ncbi:hypothetical protein LTR05_001028 [Lithohypha guttulata]|uniref:TIGR02453 family protein n=1 Tax=Lithohypha guttulata TaxID=1690604 RepID=A0AAN7TDQ9_9EURO|nr:hypothetical protein LTR05_001028 [Lithohypha guttulata]
MPKRKSAPTAARPTSKSERAVAATTPQHDTSTPATRSSKRIKVTSSTKSKYFSGSGNDEDSEDAGASDSGYDDQDVKESDASESEVSEASDDSDIDHTKARRSKKGRPSGSTSKATVYEKTDLWREGVKTGLGPGKQVFIERPKARGDGGIAYVPERIHPHTLEFLKDLKRNNDRIWLKAHDADFRASWKDFESFVEVLTEKIAEIDETVPELPPKDLVFRIYRDVRFSSDPTPYKPHFSAAFSRTGRKGPYACYYVQIQPGGRCFVGSGLWHPEAAPLALLRADINSNPDQIRNVLMDAGMRKHIFGGVGKDVKKATQAFCKQNEENALKTKPKGYDVDHPNIELLRLKNFTVGQNVSDDDILSSGGLGRILELIRVMQPFVAYLNSIVMPDEAADTDDDSSSSSSNTSPTEDED